MRDWFAAFRKAPDGSNLEPPEQVVSNKGVAGCDTCDTIEIVEEIAPHPDKASGVTECGTKDDRRVMPHVPHPIPRSGVTAKVQENQGCHTCHTCHTVKCNEPFAGDAKKFRIARPAEDFHGQASGIAGEKGIGQFAATGIAPFEFGYVSTDRDFLSGVSNWQSALATLPSPVSLEGQKLLNATRWFLGSPFCEDAIHCGWKELELFGCHERAPLTRQDAMGLIPTLAWSKLDAKLRAIDHQSAIVETRSGAQLTHHRLRTGEHESVVFWDHPFLVADLECPPLNLSGTAAKPVPSCDSNAADQADIVEPLEDAGDFLAWANQVGEAEIERDARGVYALYCEFCEVYDLTPLTKQTLICHLIGAGAQKRLIRVNKRNGTKACSTVYLLPRSS